MICMKKLFIILSATPTKDYAHKRLLDLFLNEAEQSPPYRVLSSCTLHLGFFILIRRWSRPQSRHVKQTVVNRVQIPESLLELNVYHFLHRSRPRPGLRCIMWYPSKLARGDASEVLLPFIIHVYFQFQVLFVGGFTNNQLLFAF